MIDDKSRIEFGKWLLERNLGWISTADVKVGVAMSVDIAMLGGLAAAFSASEPTARTAWCYFSVLVAIGCLILGVFCAAMAALPRMLGPVDSKIFFGRVANTRADHYVDEFGQLTERQIIDDLAMQIHRNAQIANDKHVWIRKGLMWSFLSAVPWIAGIALLLKI